MTDFDAFDQALKKEQSYMKTFTRSMSLVLDEFYKNIKTVGVSAATGTGVEDLFKAIKEASKEYYEVFVPMMEKRKKAARDRKAEAEKKELERIRKDIKKSKGLKPVEESDEEDEDRRQVTPQQGSLPRRSPDGAFHL